MRNYFENFYIDNYYKLGELTNNFGITFYSKGHLRILKNVHGVEVLYRIFEKQTDKFLEHIL